MAGRMAELLAAVEAHNPEQEALSHEINVGPGATDTNADEPAKAHPATAQAASIVAEIKQGAGTVEVPAVHTAAVLVDVHITQAHFRKKDRKASDKVTGDAGARRDAATVHKNLLAGCDELVALNKFVSRVRAAVTEDWTLPWTDRGARLLPTAKLMDFHHYITEQQAEFEQLTRDFLDVYDWRRTNAEAELGTLFDPTEYPPLDRVERKFSFHIGYMPVPDTGDFRVDMGNEAVDMLKTHYESFYTDRISAAMENLWQRLYAPLARMSERLDYDDTTDKKKFHDTLVGNVLDMVQMLKDCNFNDDMQMNACAQKLEAALYGVTPEALRHSPTLRAKTKQAVDDVIKTIPYVGAED